MSAQANWGASARKSFRQATKHFDKWVTADTSLTQADHNRLFGRGEVPHTYDNLKHWEVMDKDLDYFGAYFPSATWLSKSNTELSLNSADQYFSAIKTDINRECMNKRKKCKLTESGTRTIRQGMVKLFIARAIRQNKKVSGSHETSTLQDIITIAMLCFWAGTFSFADMLFLFLSLRYLAGRGGEIGRIPRSSVTLDGVADWDDPSEQVWRVWFWRPKTEHPQEVPIFTHKHEVCLDWPFAFGYSMVMNPSPNENLFPTFASKVDADEDADDLDEAERESKQNKKITQHFNDMITRLVKLCQNANLVTDESDTDRMAVSLVSGVTGGEDEEDGDDEEESKLQQGATIMEESGEEASRTARYRAGDDQQRYLNPRISSHSQKRNAVETANAHPLIQTTWLCLMAGWIMKAVHTIYDYLKSGNKSNDEQVALCWSGWNQPGYLGRLGGGHPPMISAIQTHTEWASMGRFIKTLFVSYRESESFFPADSNPREREAIFEMATAAILLRLKPFIDILLDHPQAKYGSKDDHPGSEVQRLEKAFQTHPFLQRLKAAADSVGLEYGTLLEWSDLVERDFIRRNFVFAAWSDVRRVVGEDQLVVDSRNLTSFMERIVANHREQNNQISELRSIVVEEHQARIGMQEQLSRVEASSLRVEALLESLVGVVGPRAAAAPGTSQPPERASRRTHVDAFVAFPSSLEGLEIRPAFCSWFVNGHYLAVGTDQVACKPRRVEQAQVCC